jgi:hypothetical protein
MPVNIYPTTALTVFEKQNFINKFVVPAGTVVQSYTISTSASPIGVNWNSAVTVTSDATTSITIAGFYDNVFVATTVRAVADKSTAGSEVTYTNFTDIPTNPYPYAFTYYQPDTRDQIEVTVVINCNTGTTSLTQYVRNDYNYYRNRFIDLVHAAQVDVRTNTSFVAPDLPLPGDINSEDLKNIFVFTTSLSTNIQYYNVMTAATAAGYTGSNALFATVNVNPGVYVWSDNVSLPAFQTGTLPSGVGVHNITLNNDGYIIGRGANGVGGSVIALQFQSANGNPGGPAISLAYNVTINNNSYIAGGGGSGATSGYPASGNTGGGAGGGNGAGDSPYFGGTGGQPGQAGTQGFSTSGNFPGMGGGGGGGRILPGTGGFGSVFPTKPGGGGAGGGSVVGGYQGGTGGAGGSAGNQGQDKGDRSAGGSGGWGARGGNCGRSGFSGVPSGTPGVGGAGGKAIALNGYTVTYGNIGTIYGTVS